VVLAIAVGALGVMGFQATFFIGTRANGVAVGTMLALGSSPLLTGLMEWIVLRTRPTLLWIGATVLAVAGIASISITGQATQSTDWLGVLASLAAGASYAAYTVAVKVLLTGGWHSQDAVSTTLGCGSLLGFAVLAFTDTSWLAEPSGIAVASWLAVIAMIIPYSLIGVGLKRVSASTASTLTMAEPATATLLGILVLHETLTWPTLLGVSLIVISVLLLTLPSQRPKPVTDIPT
jgi:DME family drug/metabolite transporter